MAKTPALKMKLLITPPLVKKKVSTSSTIATPSPIKKAVPTKKAKRLPSTKLSPEEPLWKGPEVDGITQSLLSRFLVCRERFRLLVIEGLREPETFDAKMEFGNMWHLCEEHFAAKAGKDKSPLYSGDTFWLSPLQEYTKSLQLLHPEDRYEIVKWYELCRRQFPIYVEYWAKNQDVKDRTPVYQEQSFAERYLLPSGRTVMLRGKWDSVDLIGKRGGGKAYIQENKTKGDVNQIQICEELTFNLQTMLYTVALALHNKRIAESASTEPRQKSQTTYENQLALGSIGGVRYNVVRRPLSSRQGGGNMRQRKGRKTKKGLIGAETSSEFYDRVASFIKVNPSKFFFRTKVDLTPNDVNRFRRECLDPILENLCDWWHHVSTKMSDPFSPAVHIPYTVTNINSDLPQYRHYRFPFGVFNPILEGRRGSYAEYLLTGNKHLLTKVPTLFRELA